MYIYERSEWPYFTWNHKEIYPLLASARHEQGRLLGRMETLGYHSS
ncbi:MAG: hypothetical protein ACD_16C00054G0026 [uncultured bacterium]|nr:MAG: hypothetical protein ACD_16C00054G0026 [uncultured bacterium]HBG34207.1 hypothetical protein [Holosporales bacterium]HBW25472.1 hypothetical protein [Holosporales bacterium]HCC25436.1 hypothetical protein [Holosporales bacterium]HCE95841.1 hypothetical protein [Holosporales bacterium]